MWNLNIIKLIIYVKQYLFGLILKQEKFLNPRTSLVFSLFREMNLAKYFIY